MTQCRPMSENHTASGVLEYTPELVEGAYRPSVGLIEWVGRVGRSYSPFRWLGPQSSKFAHPPHYHATERLRLPPHDPTGASQSIPTILSETMA